MNDFMEMVMAGHYEKNGDYKNARKFYEKALKKSPSSAEVHEKLGSVCKMMDDIDSSRFHFESCLELDPENKMCIYGMGIIERISGNYHKSMENYMKLMNMGIDNANICTSVGVLYSELGEMENAFKFYKTAFQKNPDNELVRFNLSLCLMTMGNFKLGLELYESRIWHARPPGTEWKGESNVNLLIAPEQGNGDIIQFARYIPLLKNRCKRITVLCNAPLVDLISRVDGVDEVMEFNPGDEFVEVEKEKKEEDLSRPLPFEKFTRMMSIPHVLGIDPSKEEFKNYIKLDQEKVDFWKQKINSKKVKVGLCWQGGKRNKPEMMAIDKRRSVCLEEMSSILDVEGVEFYSLQKHDDQHLKFVQIKDLMNYSESFDDTAAMIENLDLVISVDTAVAHVSAALGKPTWMLSRKGGCWRWGMSGESTFWYPSMRIFRQDEISVWGSTIENVSKELKKFVQASIL